MSEHHSKKFAGVWLDSVKAMIIIQNEKEAGSYILNETVKGAHSHSGSNEHTMNNARQSEDLKYFKSVATALLPFDEILIFGPGQAQEQLQHHLQEQVTFQKKKITIDTAQQLTDNQAIATVRDFFKGRS
jgi:stalled ribosome rescue protein Dom34